ncbi:MAG TPA: VTT domain-containing protein [Methanoregulaceae archaeon]|nr:MAG: VTT domain-containing protein [Methanolinea sp.]HON82207.1 VTT domain-containing protein [Methanoregulaceae archaeon]HPD09990.1 VTT domain-containing protein [Methanoregulaceae archaeon]HRT14995.1 VTT domain-containing protein [Methanoregulaceae archaeon]HRU30567.1 VTT domain-containing protein [Methanoregulaceae archaeon]
MIPPDLLSISQILGDVQGTIPLLMETYGIWIYAILFLIIFCETGLVFTPFLPGDSLLFLMGFLAAGGGINVVLLIVILAAAAIIGDSVNYRIGNYFGDRLLRSKRCLVDKRHVTITREYFRKYGKNTIVLARFIPGIRSFAPFVAGIIRMDYPEFLTYNAAGGIFWVGGFVLFGYAVASLPLFRGNQDFFLWAILIITIGMFFFMMIKFRKSMKDCALENQEI